MHSGVIACVGLPGSGKSTVGQHLAQKLGISFVDSDREITHRIQCTIREFFQLEGEEAFRDAEQSVIEELMQKKGNFVLSTGGGAILRSSNRQILHQNAKVVYLHSMPEHIFSRLRHDQTRPLMQGHDPLTRLRELYNHRDELYRQTAHFTVEAAHLSISAVSKKIQLELNQDREN